MATMKALWYEKYGPPSVVHIKEVPKPVPKDNEVLVRIRATTISTGDWRGRSLTMPPGFGLMGRCVFGFFAPRKKILGTEYSGIIEAVGKSVTKWKPGDAVFASPGAKMGGHAEYATMAENGPIAAKPPNLSFEEAAALCFGPGTALHFLRSIGKVQAGERVVIVGASGCVGSSAVQLAKHFGAHVTGVCSTANVDLVRSIGADEVIDYTKVDFAQNGKTYDAILDSTATVTMKRCEGSLNPNGRLLMVAGTFWQFTGLEWASDKSSGKKTLSGVSEDTEETLRFIADLAISGKFKPVIDRVYPLEQGVEAHTLVDSGRKKGAVVLTVA